MSGEVNPIDSYIPTPDKIDGEGLLVGWSLEHENKNNKSKPIGYVQNASQEKPPETLKPILHNGPGHLMTIASTGAGKGVGCIIPALLRHKGSVVVIDPKGENYAVTARARREMGQQVVLLDPFKITGESKTDCLNPLDMVLKFEGGEIEQCKMLADMIVVPNPQNHDPFWDNRAKQFITAFLLNIAETSPPALQNLSELRLLLNQSRKEFEFSVKYMAKSKIPECKLAASSIFATEPKVLASILSTAQYHTDFMAGSLISAATSGTSFDLEDVILGKPLSIYIVIPPDKIDTSSQLIRLWIGTLFNLIMMRSQAPEERTLFILDEAAQLGHLNLLTRAITLLRGYGLQTWSFWQDLSQLTTLYPDWETLYNNCRVHQNFGVTNARFAKQVSELTDYPSHREILKLDNDEMLLQIAGDEVVIAQRPNYLTDAIFKDQADENPFHSKEDDDDLAPQHTQRRYKRRTNQKISNRSETEDLKQQLKDAIKSAKDATEEANEAKRKLENLLRTSESKDERTQLNLAKKKPKDESEAGEPWTKL